MNLSKVGKKKGMCHKRRLHQTDIRNNVVDGIVLETVH